MTVSAFLLGSARARADRGSLLSVFTAVRDLLDTRGPATPPRARLARRTRSAYVTWLGLTLAKPPPIRPFAAVLAGLGALASTSLQAAALVPAPLSALPRGGCC